MTKTQKIWMGIFIAMFAIPEILWSPVANFIYSFLNPPSNGYPVLLRNNFLFNYQNEWLLKAIILIQLVGVILFSILWFKSRISIKPRFLFLVVMALGSLISLIILFIFYLVFMFSPSF